MPLELSAQSNAQLLNQIQPTFLRDEDLKPFADGFFFPPAICKQQFFRDHHPLLFEKYFLFRMRAVRKSTTNLIALRRSEDYLLAWFTEEFFKILLSQMAHSRVCRDARILQNLPTDKFKRFLKKSDLVLSPFVYSRARRARLSSGSGEIAKLDCFVVDFYKTLAAAKMSHGDLHFITLGARLQAQSCERVLHATSALV